MVPPPGRIHQDRTSRFSGPGGAGPQQGLCRSQFGPKCAPRREETRKIKDTRAEPRLASSGGHRPGSRHPCPVSWPQGLVPDLLGALSISRPINCPIGLSLLSPSQGVLGNATKLGCLATALRPLLGKNVVTQFKK